MGNLRLSPEQLEKFKARTTIEQPELESVGTKVKYTPRPGATLKPGEMNKTETRWSQLLDLKKRDGEILDYRYEPIKLRIGHNCFYTPDFMVVCADRFIMQEIKGGWIEDDAMVKFKAAANLYPWFVWEMHQYKKREWRRVFNL